MRFPCFESGSFWHEVARLFPSLLRKNSQSQKGEKHEHPNGDESLLETQAFENKIVAVHEGHGAMTRDRCRKLVRPERSPGGFGEFLKAYSNLVHAGVLSVKGKTQRASKCGLN